MNFDNSSTLKVAVCFSGQPRFWKIAADNIKNFFNFEGRYSTTITTDYFIHTWDTNTIRYPKTHHWIFENTKQSDTDDIIATYNPKGFEQEEWVQDTFPRAWDSMFYSFARSMMLKRNYEIANNFEYDIVVKARLDTIYDPNLKFPIQIVNPGMCYSSTPISKFPSEFHGNNFDDVIFYGDSKTMDLMGELYDTFKLFHSSENVEIDRQNINQDPTMFYGPGCLLYEHCKNLNIYPDGSRVFDYVVVRSTIADAKLNCITDYQEVRRLGREWYI